MRLFLVALSAFGLLARSTKGQSAAFILGGLFQSGLEKREDVKTMFEECTFTEEVHVWASGELFGCSQGGTGEYEWGS